MIYASVGGKVRKSEDQKALEAFSQVTELLLCYKKKDEYQGRRGWLTISREKEVDILREEKRSYNPIMSL